MTSREVLDFFKGRKIDDGMLKKLNVTLISVNGVLDYAEEKQIAKMAAKEWLNELKDAVYEAEYLLDEIAYEALRMEMEMEMEAGRFRSSKFQLSNLLSSLNPLTKRRKEIQKKLEVILSRLEYLVKQKDALGLGESVGEKQSAQKIPTTTSLVDESGVYSRDGDKEAILKLLLTVDANGSNADSHHWNGWSWENYCCSAWFDIKAWVCVSEEFDISKLTKDSSSDAKRTTVVQDAKRTTVVQEWKPFKFPNKNGETSAQLFTKSHKKLVIEGEKRMKDTASCTVVGALIITIMFIAACTLPKGNIQDIGILVFLHEKAFKTFIISDAISLFSSSTSTLMFLGILTSCYGEEDFLISFPWKLIIDLYTLFISIAAMMVAFSTALMLDGMMGAYRPC